MREIKFRAWDAKFKVMFEHGEISVSEEESPISFVSLFNNPCEGFYVMQFTGLRDKNGREIYEGDMIRQQVNSHIWFYQIGCIDDGGANLYAINIRDNVTIDDETDTYTYQMTEERVGQSRLIPSGCEIIGNIYENPELLEAKP